MSNIDRKLRPITRDVLDRVREAKVKAGPEPEFELFVKQSKLGMASSFLYEVFPEGAVRFLGKVIPNSESIKNVLKVWDFRTEHGFPAGYIPASYNLPSAE